MGNIPKPHYIITIKNTHPLVATNNKTFACYGFTVPYAFNEAVPHNCVLVFTCVGQQAVFCNHRILTQTVAVKQGPPCPYQQWCL